MATRTIMVAMASLLVGVSPVLASKGFLVGKSGTSTLDAGAFQSEVRRAMAEASGCGGHVSSEQLQKIETALTPMWNALPKSHSGRIERRLLRYIAHRYFYENFALVLRGFEPSRAVNESVWGNADILSERVPEFVEAALESEHAQLHGFDLPDAVRLVATLEELILDSDSALLEKIYASQSKPTSRSLSFHGLSQVLEIYMVHWMLGGDVQTTQALIKNPQLRSETIPHWDMVQQFAQGQIQALQHQRMHAAKMYSRADHNALAAKYSFEDAHKMVGNITRGFSSFWESECRSMTATLIQMDPHNTGRVPLSKFYHGAVNSEWRFGESEAYLRELGALDETSNWRGKQVIITNYMQAASNCIVSTPHYMVCCANYCDQIFNEIEKTIGAPTAEPLDILYLVGNMSSQTTLEEEDVPQLDEAMTQQLNQIAAAHGGKIPIHGRLFAQWLHYAFPRVCPFPQKTGTVANAVPHEYGDAALATETEMNALSQTVHEDSERMGRNEEWMSQWSSDEELIADYGVELRAAWDTTTLWAVSGILFAVFSVAGIIGVAGMKEGDVKGNSGMLPAGRSHFV